MDRPPSDSSARQAWLDAIAGRRLFVLAGKGGVGRTTVAAWLAQRLSERGGRVLVATTGLDDRLAWMLGADALADEARPAGARIEAQRLVPAVCLREYGTLVLRSERLSRAVFDNRLVRGALSAIPGLDDFAVLGKVWHEAMRSGRYDHVVFDGPASGHLRLMLGIPKAIVGAAPPGPLVEEARRMVADLADPAASAAVLVGLPEVWPLTELGELGAALADEVGIDVGFALINAMPRPLPPRAPLGPGAPRACQDLDAFLRARAELAERAAQIVEAWRAAPAHPKVGARALAALRAVPGGITEPARLAAL